MTLEFNLPKTGDTATVGVLDAQHLAQVLALQDETRKALPDAQKMFVLPQSADYFTQLLKHQNGVMIGVRVRGQLVAQMALMGQLSLDDAITKNAITRNEIPFHHVESADLVVVAKSMAVHPDWRGHELSQHLLSAALEQGLARTADHVFAQVSADNVRSWELFLRSGFGIVAAAVDPDDKKPRFILQRPALGLALHDMSSVDNLDPVADFSAIMRLTGREALIGRIDEFGQNYKLEFYAAQNTAAAWSDNDEADPAGSRLIR